jgi:hypothetical protein
VYVAPARVNISPSQSIDGPSHIPRRDPGAGRRRPLGAPARHHRNRVRLKTGAPSVSIFDRHRPQITHPRPEVAVPFAISSAASLLQVRIVFNDTAPEPALPFAELLAEATRLVVFYLTG